MASDDRIETVQDVRYEREQLETRVAEFLRGKGWTYTSNTPGSFWLWEREIGGRRVLVEVDMAIAIQDHLDADAR
jgi:hypothetical protein